MRYFLFANLLLMSFFCHAQRFQTLENGNDQVLASNFLGRELNYTLYLPKAMKVSENLKYPIAIVFDRQNERTSNHIVETIDYMSASFSIPEFIVVTIEQEERFFESSVKMPRNGSGGIDLFLACVLNELDSILKADYRANDYKLLLGHSRTAFLSIYALAKYPAQVNASIANSPFFVEPANKPIIDLIDELKVSMKQFEKNRYLSFSAGDSLKDPHFDFSKTATNRLKLVHFQEKFHWNSKMHPFADHYTVVAMHTAGALAWIYDRYSSVLDGFIAAKDKSRYNAEWLREQMKIVSDHYGEHFSPALVHFNSMASYFAQENQPLLAIELLKYGLELYPYDTDLNAFLASMYQEISEHEKAKHYFEKAISYLDLSPWYNDLEKKELQTEIEAEIVKLESSAEE